VARLSWPDSRLTPGVGTLRSNFGVYQRAKVEKEARARKKPRPRERVRARGLES
jgi:hypothetical protein